MPGLEAVGLHFHLGSPIFEVEAYQEAVDIVMAFAARMRERYGFVLQELNTGGGFAAQYVEGEPPPPVAQYAEAIVSAVAEAHQAYDPPLSRLTIEPGRAIIAPASLALYSVGASKEVSGVRRFASVDGGMADNIRPALYGSQYTALVANKLSERRRDKVTIAGKYCESGDILLRDVELPPLDPGDLIAVPATGAYALAMASNYNASLRPAIVMVRDGNAKLIRRRETYDDLMRCDVYPPE
jgi:diaminopimelate decarboxylase